ncbi:hypothetical protein [Lentzea sp. HUAS12]|nr:hypothetical protein [Lentzea sp. HUAS12]USX53893.1 hypothetical protein ND450_07255 [Lentzea sp. HUAS12]
MGESSASITAPPDQQGMQFSAHTGLAHGVRPFFRNTAMFGIAGGVIIG